MIRFYQTVCLKSVMLLTQRHRSQRNQTDFYPFGWVTPLIYLLWMTISTTAAAAVPPSWPQEDSLAKPNQPANVVNRGVDQQKPVQVYIMLGQSNMLGFGRVGPRDTVGSLEYLVKEQAKYPHLIDNDGNWVTRDDVRYMHVMDKRGVDYKNLDEFQIMRNEWLKPTGSFGPELGFGHVLGDFHDEPVLLLKACIGNRSLGWDLLPPGSERFEHDGKIYAGYKDVANFWEKGSEPKPVSWYAGRQYDADTQHAKLVLKQLEEFVPEYAGQGYEIAGFVWWQGHKDQNAALAGRYEQNLVHLINTLRTDFDAPDAKFVLATGCGNPGREGFGLQIAEAQLAVDGEQGKYPEFKGNVATVDVRDLWRDANVSPVNQGHHYNHNAETYYEVGEALGKAMQALLQAQAAKK
jgi:alpha-galactosidase